MIACRSPDRDPDGPQPRSIRRQLPPVGRQRGIHSTGHLYERASSSPSVRGQCQEPRRSSLDTVPPPLPLTTSCRAPTILWKWPHHARPFAVDTRTVTSTPVDDSASRLSAHAAPLVSPRSSSTHGKLCDDPSPEDCILFKMFQRHERGSRLNSSFFFGGALPCHPKLSQRLRRCFGSRSSGIEIALVRGRRDVDGGGQSLPAMLSLVALGGLFALGSCDVVCRTATKKSVAFIVRLDGGAPLPLFRCRRRRLSRWTQTTELAPGRWRRVCHQNTHSGTFGNGELRRCPAPPPRNTGDSMEPMPRSQLARRRRPDAVDAMAVGAG
ncbi:hypothetical protein B0T18DRAFT_396384 [Schizothecium vesticola]|uniref:Uncharacterized protein n=1 Tax=Schizothecium vesticola TaxID=314040 RepID=A0AA40KBM7_9PEZI|nr:hypothetical protein B0T18DRAFT_396384 [Schizothecium vesticola]